MRFPRASGVLLHPTSLPGPFGIGDLGPQASAFADFLTETGMKIWQILPLSPTGYGDSPYQSFSAFAGNPMLISPEILVQHGYLSPSDVAGAPDFPVDRVDFGWVVPFKWDLLRKAFQRFRLTPAYARFTAANRDWLDPFARFMALKKANGGHAWTEWTTDRADEEEIEFHMFCQFEFFEEWRDLKSYCARHGIRIFGDTPIYVAHDSADVWANRELFELKEDGRPLRVAGVPPDYFSATGQLWGNPIYRWDRLAEAGFRWWIDRLRMTLQTVDMIRLDHFRGFEAFWAVPGGDDTAVNGEWVKGPCAAIFEAAQKALGELPIVAENLGVITPEVEALREQFGFPGMAVLQFAFGTDPQAPTFRPHNFPRELAAYTGTHDNDTTIGWWTGVGVSTRSAEDIEHERAFTKDYLNTDGREMHWDFIRTILASVADIAVVPLQDVLGLGSEARMNTPAVMSGNWGWRFREEALTLEIRTRLKRLTNLYDR